MPNEEYITSPKEMRASEEYLPYALDTTQDLSHSDVNRTPMARLVLPVVAYMFPPISKSTMEDDMEKKFNRLARTWKAETGMLSRLDEKYMHVAYQQIIGMGEAAIPFILRDLKETRGHWLWALRAIAGESPVPQKNAGNLSKVIEAWLEWGRKRGYVI